jgi:hypothetical protein
MSDIDRLYRNLQRVHTYKLACQELNLLSVAYTNAATQRQRNVLLQTVTDSVTEMENSIKREINQILNNNNRIQ